MKLKYLIVSIMAMLMLSACGSGTDKPAENPDNPVEAPGKPTAPDTGTGDGDTEAPCVGCPTPTPSPEDPVEEDPDLEEPTPDPGPTPGHTNNNYYPYQWHLHSRHSASWADNDAGSYVDQAWKASNKGNGIIIAVIDSGFDQYHEDLVDNVYDTYNAGNGSKDVSLEAGDQRHGTQVAGLIAGSDNGFGVMGSAPNARLILIKLAPNQQAIINAFRYAKEHGAKVISCSWGTKNITDVTKNILKEMKDADIVTLFACGNDGASLDQPGINDECEDTSVIGISSSSEKNKITSYGNYGKNVDFLAPAGEYGLITIDDIGDDGFNKDQLNTLKNKDYTFFAGTSAATPVAAGIVGLMRSTGHYANPDTVYNALRSGAEKIGEVSYDNTGWNDTYAYGKINAEKSVKKIQAFDP